jgi:hypothetical protein
VAVNSRGDRFMLVLGARSGSGVVTKALHIRYHGDIVVRGALAVGFCSKQRLRKMGVFNIPKGLGDVT